MSQQFHIAGVNFAVSALTDITDDLTDRLFDDLTAPQLADVAQLSNPKRRRERIAVYRLINQHIAFGLTVGHHPDGSPYLVGAEQVRFSLSHSATRVAIAWSREARAIGIDVEDETDKLTRVAPRFVRPEERDLPLLSLWTAKEAAFKALGPQSTPLTLIDIRITPDLLSAHTPAGPLRLHLLPGLALAYKDQTL